ncbi:MAG: hypothetical protein A2900_02735 [Candidatus Chisholmbacteria bacterium RIFCSPLOWO2_01_FULL_50_28]|uniref:Uncharacterized protein n=1 Tax=Candidatus Chisholmbacteria bacterium RIFCSPHIGHO2_01_FULL_52_32 TaxID=1797591 RepID=A0A1G1VTA6_9BACT|nr:MAG: hypothetical protein A2786_04010 [Candidatus Chisholmbacteria bacterium RIFCSPHIGHO2_01_FULL_52_32]OGY19993.1 MAG: hypothetical protein A2900_02735 [Candidatus Chisholmbacteria bacterium RIFCSPLOWO2_01_FULL_50_28]
MLRQSLKSLTLLIALLVLPTGIWAIGTIPQTPNPPSAQTPPTVSTQRVIVRFRSFVPKLVRSALHNTIGTQEIQSLLPANTVVVQVPEGQEDSIAKRYKDSVWVEYAEPDALAYALEIPNDPQFSGQWGQYKTQTPGAWDMTHDGSVDIAILDTGIAESHPDVTGKVDEWQNYTRSSSRYDRDGHGTHVAGIAAALTNNGLGIAGTGYNARLYSVKVLDDQGAGYYSWIINGIYWATDNGAEVINMSLGGSSGSSALQDAVNYAWGKGVVVVAAAGNSGSTQRSYPAYYDKAIAVAATDANDKKASFSSYGSWVDIAAPGVNIISTIPNNDYDTLSGTSMATPHVAGVAALIKATFPSDTNQQIRDRLEQTADKIQGTGTYWSAGRVNAAAAVGGVVSAPPTPTPTSTPTPTPTPTPLPTLTPTPTPTPSPTGEPTPTPTPTPTSKPWWCRYIPSHYTCQ